MKNSTSIHFSGGSVGINTANPQYTLDVNGTISIGGMPVINATGAWEDAGAYIISCRDGWVAAGCSAHNPDGGWLNNAGFVGNGCAYQKESNTRGSVTCCRIIP